MKQVIQRVSSASVQVDKKVVAQIEQGLLVFVGFSKEDNENNLHFAANKLCNLRIFSDSIGKFQHSIIETKADVLLVRQFTLLADTSKGRRPEFFSAMQPDQASDYFQLYTLCCSEILGKQVKKGVFGAKMQVALVNDGPVTILL